MADVDALVAFLRARLDEDESAARQCLDDLDPTDMSFFEVSNLTDYDSWNLPREEARHIARHNPARVLADVDAKRRIIDKCEQIVRSHLSDDFTADWMAEEILQLLGLPDASHPDYREEWRP